MKSTVIEVTTGSTEAVHDITPRCAAFLREVGAGDGLLHVFIPHATAGIALIELGAGSDDDLLAALATCCRPTTAGGMHTAPAAMAAPMSCRRSSHRT
jgi:thiamine phosphate synthase YjbQ (UPF0047 family)